MAFGKHFSIEEFKAAHNTNRIDIILNPKTQNQFMVSENGKVLGAVSAKLDRTRPLQVVELVDESTGTVVPCLCNASTANVVFSL